MFSCKFAAYFQNAPYQEHIWVAASECFYFISPENSTQPKYTLRGGTLNIYLPQVYKISYRKNELNVFQIRKHLPPGPYFFSFAMQNSFWLTDKKKEWINDDDDDDDDDD